MVKDTPTPSSSQVTPRDRTLECAVCGKFFTRGHLDLTRHMNAVTLQHLFSKELSNDFPIACNYGCGIYFMSEEHLLQHQQNTTCGRTKGSKKIRSFHDDLFADISNNNNSNSSIPLSTPMNVNSNSHFQTPINEIEVPPSSSSMKISPNLTLQHPENIANSTELTHNNNNIVTEIININAFNNENNEHSLTKDSITNPSEDTRQISLPPVIFEEKSELEQKEMELMPLTERNDQLLPHDVAVEGIGEVKGSLNNQCSPIESISKLAVEPVNLSIETSYNGDVIPEISNIETPSSRRSDSKTMECMVCGKLFPRGPIDLQRHATAVTLKHLVSKKKSSHFNFGCARCGLFFTSADHLTMHDTYSTCNPSLVWPHFAETMSGLRAIPKSQLGEMPIPPPICTPTMGGTTPGSVSGRKSLANTGNSSSGGNAMMSPYPTKRKESFSHKNHEDFIFTPLTGTGRVTRAHSHQFDNGSTPGSGGGANSFTGKRKRQLMTIDYENIRSKRTKYIIPNERKTFFAIISLLIDPQLVNAEEIITEDNYEQFIPQEHSALIEKLKSLLQYTV